MDRVSYVQPDFPADAFQGTASYYVRHRPPYSGAMTEDLLRRSGSDGTGVLLDLACGPGRVALALAPSFREVWAVDLEPEMIEAAKIEAGRRQVSNVIWSLGAAEDFPAPGGSVDLVTIGEAFHRLDQRRTALRALEWLRPGGSIAILGCYGMFQSTGVWQTAVSGLVRKWTKRPSLAVAQNGKPVPDGSPGHAERVLMDCGFGEVSSRRFAEDHAWTMDSLLGYLYSTSVCSRKVLGADQAGFEDELGAELHRLSPEGIFPETISWGYTFGRKAPC